MTSISAASGSNYLSPLQLLQNELQTEVSSGAISSSDQSALSSALNDINSSLQSDRPSGSGSGTNASPGDLQSKINTLIAGEVSSGKLTSDQATELQGVFAAAFANGPGGAADPAGASAAGAGVAPAGPGGPVDQVPPAMPTVAIMLAMAVRHPAALPPAHPRAAPPAVHRAPAPPTTFCSSFSNRCRIRCRTRRHPTMQPAAAAPPAQVVRRSRRCSSTIRPDPKSGIPRQHSNAPHAPARHAITFPERER